MGLHTLMHTPARRGCGACQDEAVNPTRIRRFVEHKLSGFALPAGEQATPVEGPTESAVGFIDV
jgi:hypothetical protein